MHKTLMSQKRGVILFIVLGTLLVVVILASVVLTIILSHSRITHHQVSRIRAYYAAQAGINLALEKIRTGTWGKPGISKYCINCSSGAAVDGRVDDSDIPYEVMVELRSVGTGNCRPTFLSNGYCLSAKATYTYTP